MGKTDVKNLRFGTRGTKIGQKSVLFPGRPQTRFPLRRQKSAENHIFINDLDKSIFFKVHKTVQNFWPGFCWSIRDL